MKLAILGNSHVACLKLGWVQAANEFPDTNITFFTVGGMGLTALEFRDGVLVPGNEKLAGALRLSSGGLDRIELALYDAIFILGMGMRMPFMMRGVSRAVRERSIRDIVDDLFLKSLCNFILENTEAPLLVAPAFQWTTPPESIEFNRYLNYDEVFSDLAAHFAGTRLVLVKQPSETFDNAWFTKPQYHLGLRKIRRRLGDEVVVRKEIDRAHMTAEFGALYLRHLLRRVLAQASAFTR